MSNEFKRIDRVAQLIQRKLAQIIQMDIKDPRLPNIITVSHVSVSKDMSFAKIYITVLSEKVCSKDVIDILTHATSYLRAALARTIKLRTIPQLKFIYDDSVEYGSRLSKLIDELNVSNDEND